jgi:hypothetical protein
MIEDFPQKLLELLIKEIDEQKISKEEFYDYGKMSKNFNHSKILKVICRALENVGYEWLTDVRINKTTVGQRLRSQTAFVADVIGYKQNTVPTNFSVIIEYETIDSAKIKRKWKIVHYIERMFKVKNIEFYVMIAVFTTTITRKTRNREKDQWGVPRDRKEIYKQIIARMGSEIKELSEESKFSLISIFDDKIVGQIFNRNGEEVKNRIEKRIRIREL